MSFRLGGIRRIILAFAMVAVTLTAQGAELPGRTLMRFPTLYGNTVVFVATTIFGLCLVQAALRLV